MGLFLSHFKLVSRDRRSVSTWNWTKIACDAIEAMKCIDYAEIGSISERWKWIKGIRWLKTGYTHMLCGKTIGKKADGGWGKRGVNKSCDGMFVLVILAKDPKKKFYRFNLDNLGVINESNRGHPGLRTRTHNSFLQSSYYTTGIKTQLRSGSFKYIYAHPPWPARKRHCSMRSNVGRASTSTRRQARTSDAASPRAPPPSGSSPSVSFPSHLSSKAIEAFANGDSKPSWASDAVMKGHSPTSRT